jgi:hypothetical protein
MGGGGVLKNVTDWNMGEGGRGPKLSKNLTRIIWIAPKVVFKCPQPGIVGNIVTVQNLASLLDVLEIEVLGEY